MIALDDVKVTDQDIGGETIAQDDVKVTDKDIEDARVIPS